MIFAVVVVAAAAFDSSLKIAMFCDRTGEESAIEKDSAVCRKQ